MKHIANVITLFRIPFAILRFAGYGIGFYKYHIVTSLHTYANKVTGAFIFAAPILYSLFGLTVTGVLLCAVAFTSALEEVLITVTSKESNRDCKSVFVR